MEEKKPKNTTFKIFQLNRLSAIAYTLSILSRRPLNAFRRTVVKQQFPWKECQDRCPRLKA
jgi:hypothetical protein